MAQVKNVMLMTEDELFDSLAEEGRIHELDDGEIDLEDYRLELIAQGAFQGDYSDCHGTLSDEPGYTESRQPYLF